MGTNCCGFLASYAYCDHQALERPTWPPCTLRFDVLALPPDGSERKVTDTQMMQSHNHVREPLIFGDSRALDAYFRTVYCRGSLSCGFRLPRSTSMSYVDKYNGGISTVVGTVARLRGPGIQHASQNYVKNRMSHTFSQSSIVGESSPCLVVNGL